MEAADARRLFPEGGFVGSRLLTGEKFSELNLPEDEKIYKSRLVLQGNYVQEAGSGKKVIEDCDHDEPMQMEELNMLLG